MLDYNFLYSEIVMLGKSSMEIAVEQKCNPTKIHNLARKYNLEFRYVSLLTESYLNKEYVQKERSIVDISKEMGCSHTYVAKRLVEFGIRIRDCGVAGSLKSNKTIGELTGVQWTNIKKAWRVRSKNISEFSLTQKEAWDIFANQQGKCIFSGVDIKLARNTKDMQFGIKTASLDRIDSSRGYTNDNVCWVHKIINSMKYEYSKHYFIYLCRCVCDNNQLSNFGVIPDFYLPYEYKKHINSTGFQYVTGSVYCSINPSKKKAFGVSREYLNQLIINQRFKCKISGIPIYLPINRKEFTSCMKTASLDRIDNSIGYVEGNVQWVHTDINKSRWELQEQDYLQWCLKVATNENRI